MGAPEIFVISFIGALSGALMPGPLLTLTITQTARRGFIAPVLLILGHSILELAMVLGLVFGLSRVLQSKPVMAFVAVLGGLVLLWMGWGMIRDTRRGLLDTGMDSKGAAKAPDGKLTGFRGNLVISGITVSVLNPYWVIWWAMAGAAGLAYFTSASSSPLVGITAFYLGHITGDILWYLAVGAALVTGRRLLTGRIYGGVVQFCGVALVFFGGFFLYAVLSGNLWAVRMSTDWMK